MADSERTGAAATAVLPSAEPSAARKGALLIGTAIVALLAIVLVAILIGHDSDHPAAAPPASRTPSPSVSPHPSATPSPTTSPRTVISTPQQAIAALRKAVTRAVATGALAADGAPDLNHRLDDLSKAISGGNTDDGSHKVADLAHHIDDLSRSGKLTPAGQRLLAGPLAALERLLPPQH